ncbi:MAG: tetratricopeptide repeat protein [Bradyrhizobium sp.]|uniref:tetratricopeptide repeat protein n=1 Tax=Bradyrhizobium sp. TaxID=376 RepID=UPI001D63D271|nr:tetratricopeptide repeat protein [Bradyrhizobium sp.]MBV9563031.1 tetratricopeptide repeat protein [Bradyrhizobium sp.]
MNRRDRRAGVEKSRPAAAGQGATVLYEDGMRHLRADRPLDAQLCCRQALAVDANHADALHLAGLLALHTGQLDDAMEWTARAVRQQPKPEYLVTLGTVLRQQGRLEEALKAFDKAVQLKPDAVFLWMALGNVLVDLNRADQAILAFQHVLKLDGQHRDAAYNAGSLLCQSGRPEEALTHLDLADRLRPDHAPTLQMRALTLFSLDRFEEALADIRRAQALDPPQADICNNLGVFLHRLGRDAEALPWFERAVALRPDYVAAHSNRANSLVHLRRFTEAFAAYDQVKVIEPGNADADWAVALLHLLMGNFEPGWIGREARWKIPSLPIARFSFAQPMWLGKETIAGKTVLVHVDEGLGDTIQFVRYVPMVAELGARVLLVVPDALCALLRDLPGVSQCLPMSHAATLPPFDMYIPLDSLPLAFGTRLDTIPATTPYLPLPAPARRQVWEDRLGPHDRMRIGLVWSGNPKHKNDHNRSLPFHVLAPILDLDATFVSLQKDPRSSDQTALRARREIVDLTEHLTDFVETAALACCFDLIITVDTSMAHLAAALGRPTWILLPYMPDFRWLLDRDDSPWYPTARLFRQDLARDYGEVIAKVRAELKAKIAAWPGRSG